MATIDGVRVEELNAFEGGFLDDVERCYFTNEVRELAKKLATLPEQTGHIRLVLAVETAKAGRR